MRRINVVDGDQEEKKKTWKRSKKRMKNGICVKRGKRDEETNRIKSQTNQNHSNKPLNILHCVFK